MIKKEKILWIILVILIFMISVVIFVVNYNKNNDNKDNIYASKLENKLWTYVDSSYYNPENVLIPEIKYYSNTFKLEFSDTEVEICDGENCEISSYEIINDNIVIESMTGNKRNYKISFKEDYMILEYVHEDGSRQIFKFVVPVG